MPHAAHALLQQRLIVKGLDLACHALENNLQPLTEFRFDPQGHIILDITLNAADYQQIMRQLKKPSSIDHAKKDLEASMGFSPTQTLTPSVFCSLDIKQQPALCHAFSQWLGNADWANTLLNHPARNSIHAVQMESEKHLRLIARGIEKTLSSLPELKDFLTLPNLQKIHDLAATDLNSTVQQQFKNAFRQAWDKDTLNISALNTVLDKNRKETSRHCQQALLKAFNTLYRQHSPQGDSFTQKYQSDLTKLDKHLFSTITATGQADLRSDNDNQTCVYYEGTDFTAHDKATGIALRIKHTSHYNDQQCSPLKHKRIEARTPSIALIDISHAVAIAHVKQIFKDFYIVLSQGVYNGPIHYALLTSLNSKPFDWSVDHKNKQRRSAARILKGSHAFNREQLLAGKKHALFLVQNIPVNQHGSSLNYSSSSVIREATLMTEFALLHVFAQNFSDDYTSQSQYKEIHTLYKEFLSENACLNNYFNESKPGKSAIEHLKQFKTALAKTSLLEADHLVAWVALALRKIFSRNLHTDLSFGMLIQSLISFSQHSIIGCKSAIDRYKHVADRVECLDGLNARMPAELSREEHTFIKVLQQFAKSSVLNVSTTLNDVQKALDTVYNQAIHRSGDMVAAECSGGAPKAYASTNINSGQHSWREVDTNIVESSYLTHLHAKHAGKLQSHKTDLAEGVRLTLKTINQHTLPATSCVQALGSTHSLCGILSVLEKPQTKRATCDRGS